MLTFYDLKNGVLSRRTEPATIADTTVWIDLLSPTAEEEAAIEKALNLDVPTPAEMREIETSNRFYAENGAQYMTTSIMYGPDSEQLASTNITFILTGQRLITVRYTEPRSIQMYAERACRAGDTPCTTGAHVLVGLIETIIQRQADLIERAQDAVERFAPQIFATKSTGATRGRRLDVVLRSIGREGDVTSRMQDSITSLLRTMHYFEDAARERKEDARLLGRIDVASRDLGALSDSLKAVANRITFLLDATLGMISTEQNQIIKLFSVMAVMLMPPTLVASIYGMNFVHMPETKWEWGYPMALVAMVVAAIVPYVYFRRKGWF